MRPSQSRRTELFFSFLLSFLVFVLITACCFMGVCFIHLFRDLLTIRVMATKRKEKTSPSNSFQAKQVDEDAFWEVALLGIESSLPRLNQDDDDDDDYSTCDDLATTRSHTYTIPYSNGVTLNVQPLPSTDGIWTPLGADVW